MGDILRTIVDWSVHYHRKGTRSMSAVLREQIELVLRDNARRRAEIKEELAKTNEKERQLRRELKEVDEGSERLAALLRDL